MYKLGCPKCAAVVCSYCIHSHPNERRTFKSNVKASGSILRPVKILITNPRFLSELDFSHASLCEKFHSIQAYFKVVDITCEQLEFELVVE